MDQIPQQASLYTQHLDYLFSNSTFMFFISYLYGYSISFIYGTKKTFTISFFIVIITAILILIFTSSYVFITQCFTTPGIHCFEPNTILYSFFSWLTILTGNFFINIIIGTAGVGLGVLLYFPSEILMAKYFNVTFHDTTIHTENYTPITNAATKSGINTFLKPIRPSVQPPHPTPPPPQEQKPLMRPPTL